MIEEEEEASENWILLIPSSVPLAIFPSMISPLKGRKTIIRNLTKIESVMSLE